MSLSNYDKFLGELRLAGQNLGKHHIIEKKGEVFGLDLRGLSAKHLTKFPFKSEYLAALERLKLPKVRMQGYPPIFHLRHLTHLNMNSMHGGELPEDFYELTDLQTVNLAGNQIETISPLLSRLENLRCFALGTNHIRQLPDVLNYLPDLEYLYLFNNKLTELPPTIGELENLKVLVIEANNLKYLPIPLMKLTSLQAFKFDRNPLKLTPGNHLWLNILEDNGCQFQTNDTQTCYHFSIEWWDKNFT